MDDPNTAQVKTKMLKALEVTKTDLSTVRTGRAAPALVDHIEVLAYGSQKMKVQELATITTADSKTILIHPFDPSTRDDIVKGILEANTGLTPVAEANDIRISIPSLTEERRGEYMKLAKAKVEAGKIMIRQVRHEEMHAMKRKNEANEITEDEKKRAEKHIQEITDEMIAELDHLLDLKEKELMQI
jgi:ribosome recycling factor